MKAIQSDVMARPIRLEGNWYRNFCGEIAARTLQGEELRLVAAPFGGYRYFDAAVHRYCRVTRRNQNRFEREAQLYYPPLPENIRGFRGLLAYMLRTLRVQDLLTILLATAMITLAGVIYPMATDLLYNRVIVADKIRLLPIVLVIFLGIVLVGSLFAVVRGFMLAGIRLKMSTLMDAAVFGRCMVLPASFYKRYSAGQISEWLECIPKLCENISSLLFGAWFTSLFSLVYLVQIYLYTPAMLLPALLVVAALFVVCSLSALLQTSWTRKQMQSNSRLTGLVYDLLSGIEKIKVDNAQQRVLDIWFQQYDEVSRYTYAPPLFLRISAALPMLISTFGGILVLLFAHVSGLSSGEYMTFYSAFGMVLGAVMSASQTANVIATIKPQYEMLAQILCEPPEYSGTAESTALTGPLHIALEDVCFGYDPEHPILQHLSVNIPYGDYVAIVGSTGCGKSTLLRLLLGFEQPQQGSIRYNGEDFHAQNPAAVRRRIGVVLQNDRLFPGSILENMMMAHPEASREDIWEALRIAGMEEDVRAMPMGLQTLVGERNTSFSGGQYQRLQIARAILGHPDVLIMDEATSALDNETQAKIANALDAMSCTRIVVAHRLSTIRNCRRILVLDNQSVAEDGSYEELMDKQGKFFYLVNRQC